MASAHDLTEDFVVHVQQELALLLGEIGGVGLTEFVGVHGRRGGYTMYM